MEELSEYIKQKEEWLNSVLKRLGWTIEGLQRDKLIRCPRNEHHYVLDSKVEKHYRKCGQEEGHEDIIITPATIHITPSLQAAVLAHVKTEQDNMNLQQQQAVSVPTSLVDELVPPNDIFTHGPLHIISYIKSWKLIPKMFAVVNPAFLKLADVKAWLFKNLPCGHVHNSVIGGEVHVVEAIVQCLTQPREVGGTIDPDHVVMSTQHLLGGSTSSFILELWRFLSISSLQEQHNIPNSVVNDLVPLPLPTKPEETQRFPSHMIQAAQQPSVQEEEEQPQGAGFHNTPLSVDDRRALYDFVIEAAGRKNTDEKVDDLYRDDFNPKLRKDSNKQDNDPDVSDIEKLVRQRDYKRRRQTYRAKNVHITKRSTVEVMRDVINARMAELAAQFQEDNDDVTCRGPIKGSSSEPHVASHDPRHLGEQSTGDKYHKHHSRSRSRSHDPPFDRGSIGDQSHNRDSSSRDLKPSDKHKHHKLQSHRHHKSRSRSRSRDKKHKHKHKHKHMKE